MGRLDGKVALVTGAGGGLGRAHALLLASEGASVVVNDLGGARDGSVVVEVHLRGTYLVTKAAWDRLIEQNEGGRIIMTSSTSGLIGNFGQTNYGAAKAGIAGFMRVLALEGVKYGITVNVLAPAAWSRLTEDIMQSGVEERLAPERVSPAVAWLCTDEAKDVTGRQFFVGGNRVVLLSWQTTEIADKDADDAPWTLDEIGAAMQESIGTWPRLLRPMDL